MSCADRHWVCRGCLREHCELLVKEHRVRDSELLCPAGCAGATISIHEMEAVLPQAVWDQFLQRRLAKAWAPSDGGHIARCPQCPYMVEVDARSGDAVHSVPCRRTDCPIDRFCGLCSAPPHRGVSCEEDKRRREAGDSAQRAFRRMVAEEFQLCPSCGEAGDISGGCKFVYCRCGVQYCFHCGRRLAEEQHFSHFVDGPYGERCYGGGADPKGHRAEPACDGCRGWSCGKSRCRRCRGWATRHGARGGGCGGTRSTARAQQRKVPRVLDIGVPRGQAACAGRYTLVPGRSANGMPLWQRDGRSEQWLYSMTNGKWGIGGRREEEQGFYCNTAHVYCDIGHAGAMPQDVAQPWQWWGQGEWHLDPDVKVSAGPACSVTGLSLVSVPRRLEAVFSGVEHLFFAEVTRVTSKGKRQPRVLSLTRSHLLVAEPQKGDVTRFLRLADVGDVFVSPAAGGGDDVGVSVPAEFGLRFHLAGGGGAAEFCAVLRDVAAARGEAEPRVHQLTGSDGDDVASKVPLSDLRKEAARACGWRAPRELLLRRRAGLPPSPPPAPAPVPAP